DHRHSLRPLDEPVRLLYSWNDTGAIGLRPVRLDADSIHQTGAGADVANLAPTSLRTGPRSAKNGGPFGIGARLHHFVRKHRGDEVEGPVVQHPGKVRSGEVGLKEGVFSDEI